MIIRCTYKKNRKEFLLLIVEQVQLDIASYMRQSLLTRDFALYHFLIFRVFFYSVHPDGPNLSCRTLSWDYPSAKHKE
jgi:hypothetical protein